VTSVSRAALFRRRATRRGGARGCRTRGAGTARLGRPVVVFDFQRHAARTGFLTSSSPRRFLATSPALRLVSSSCLRRSSSSRLRASAASRSVLSTTSRLWRRRASSSAILRSSASRTRESASAWRARRVLLRSKCVRQRRTAWRLQRRWRGFDAAAGLRTGSAGAGSALTSTAPPMLRRLTFSTTTCLLRP